MTLDEAGRQILEKRNSWQWVEQEKLATDELQA